jgi:signal transduction histidine kinase/CheY-like chemotaxis protein
MLAAIGSWLKKNNISNRISSDMAERRRTIMLIAFFPLVIHALLGIFCWLQQNDTVAVFCAANTALSFFVLLLGHLRKVLSAKTLLMCVNTLAIFVYINQFDIGYNIFCYLYPLIFALFILFDFKTELPSFYLVVGVVVLSALISCFLPPYFFGRLYLPAWQMRFFSVFNIVVSALIVVVFLGLLVKITVQTERQLQKALAVVEESANVKSDFLRNMSHELRTPLNGITGTVNILLNEQSLPGQQANFNNLRHLSEHMTALVNDILDFSKMEAGSLQLYAHRFNLKALCEKVAGIFAHSFADRGVAFKLDIDERLSQFDLYGDEMRLQQVLYNLIGNALKFTDRGSVTLGASIISLQADAAELYISVTDTGIGIAPEKTADIFKSFQQGDAATTRKYGGTGLGLSICNSLMQLFGGTVHVNSTLGKGSTFYLQLTMERYRPELHGDDLAKPIGYDGLAGVKILLAEDNPINMLVASKALEKVKANVACAENGRLAIERFKNALFDIVLLDLEMPEMDGRLALAEIRKINPQVPVIAFTAAFYENMGQELLGIGFTDYLLKPFKPEDLYNKIAAAI